MGNTLLNSLQNTTLPQQNNNSINEMIKMFNLFKNNYSGNQAEQEVKNLLATGKMTPEQFEHLKMVAQQYYNLFR